MSNDLTGRVAVVTGAASGIGLAITVVCIALITALDDRGRPRPRNQLLSPTWYGETGESEEFTQDVAEEVGGAAGQQLYFLVTTNALARLSASMKL